MNRNEYHYRPLDMYIDMDVPKDVAMKNTGREEAAFWVITGHGGSCGFIGKPIAEYVMKKLGKFPECHWMQLDKMIWTMINNLH